MLMAAITVAGGAAAFGVLAPKLKTRLDLFPAKHRSLTGPTRMAKQVASLIPFYEYDEDRFFRTDNAPPEVAARRREGFMCLSQLYQGRFARTGSLTAEATEGISDLQFTGAYRVPFQFSRYVRQHL